MDRTGATGRGRRRAAWVVGIPAAAFLLIQLVPYGWSHPNPPVVRDAPWPDEQAAAIARESCYSCHSNETDWPPYSYVAPMSWLVRKDVEAGRDELNFSTWPDDDGELDDAVEQVEEHEMPPSRYTRLHPGASLTDDERRQLVDALRAMERSSED